MLMVFSLGELTKGFMVDTSNYISHMVIGYVPMTTSIKSIRHRHPSFVQQN